MSLDKFLTSQPKAKDKGVPKETFVKGTADGAEPVGSWADKYKPLLSGIVGQGKAVSEALAFVDNWKKGKAMFLHGQPGTGKTLAVEAIAAEKKLPLERLNASDKRTKDEVEKFAQATVSRPMFSKGKLILIDEADGISGRDRGAVNAIAQLVKASQFPVFIIANDPWLPKLRPLRNVCKLVKFTKVPRPSIEKRLKEICKAEGVEAEATALSSLARWCNGDLRSAVNDLQMAASNGLLKAQDLEALGYRERAASIFDIMPAIMRSGSLEAARKAVYSCDKDSDEVFLWIEANAAAEFGGRLAEVYELLSKADIFRGLVVKRQNWKFKGYMVDLMSGVSAVAEPEKARPLGPSEQGGQAGFARYSQPDRIIQMGRTKEARASLAEACATLGKELHCSSRKVKQEHLPWLRLMLAHSSLGLPGGLKESLQETQAFS